MNFENENYDNSLYDSEFSLKTLTDYSSIKNICFIKSSLEENYNFSSFLNSQTYPVVYNENYDRNSLKNKLLEKFTNIERITFAFHGISEKFHSNVIKELFVHGLTFYSTNKEHNVDFLQDLINTFNVKHVDFLGCNLLKSDAWKTFFESLQNVTVGASNDNTGNLKYGGNWVMENTMVNVKNLYFNSNLDNFTSLLSTYDYTHTDDNGNSYTMQFEIIDSVNVGLIDFEDLSSSHDVYIPSTVNLTINGVSSQYTVSYITGPAFQNKNTITTLYLPDTITHITSSNVFMNGPNYFPNNTLDFSNLVNANTTALAGMNYSVAVVIIGENFDSVDKTGVGQRFFRFGSAVYLFSYQVSENHPIYSSENGVIYDKNKTILYTAVKLPTVPCTDITTNPMGYDEFIVPYTVTETHAYAFAYTSDREIFIRYSEEFKRCGNVTHPNDYEFYFEGDGKNIQYFGLQSLNGYLRNTYLNFENLVNFSTSWFYFKWTDVKSIYIGNKLTRYVVFNNNDIKVQIHKNNSIQKMYDAYMISVDETELYGIHGTPTVDIPTTIKKIVSTCRVSFPHNLNNNIENFGPFAHINVINDNVDYLYLPKLNYSSSNGLVRPYYAKSIYVATNEITIKNNFSAYYENVTEVIAPDDIIEMPDNIFSITKWTFKPITLKKASSVFDHGLDLPDTFVDHDFTFRNYSAGVMKCSIIHSTGGITSIGSEHFFDNGNGNGELITDFYFNTNLTEITGYFSNATAHFDNQAQADTFGSHFKDYTVGYLNKKNIVTETDENGNVNIVVNNISEAEIDENLSTSAKKELVKRYIKNLLKRTEAFDEKHSKNNLLLKNSTLPGFSREYQDKNIRIYDSSIKSQIYRGDIMNESIYLLFEQGQSVSIETIDFYTINVTNIDDVNFSIYMITNETIFTKIYQKGDIFRYNGAVLHFGSLLIESTNIICFQKGTEILSLDEESGKEKNIPIEDLRSGVYVKTFKNGYIPIYKIGHRTIKKPDHNERTSDRMYKYSKTENMTNDLYITGGHSVLKDELNDKEKEHMQYMVNKLKNGKDVPLLITDNKYRLMSMFDQDAKMVENKEEVEVYHVALEHEDRFMNYGIFANGKLVESCNIVMMDDYSNIKNIM
jgi:hypothetical protein